MESEIHYNNSEFLNNIELLDFKNNYISPKLSDTTT